MYSQYESVRADSMSFMCVVRRLRFLVRFLQPKSTVIIVCSNLQFKGLHICFIHFIYIVMYASYDEVPLRLTVSLCKLFIVSVSGTLIFIYLL